MQKLNRPIFFRSNRVRRVYLGGKMFASFFGDDSEDCFFPEEWVCSSTKALNLGSTDPYEGISFTEEGEYFTELLNRYPKEMLGDRKELDVLVKLLDSAIRLPVQTHPDKAFSKIHFGSNHGKAESWVILSTRPGACIYFGFKRPVTKEEFDFALAEGDDSLIPLLNRIDVKTGDVFFIPARAVHAIGPGCLLLETQEPTDFTIQPERACGDYVLEEAEKYLGLDREVAMECFDLTFDAKKAAAYSRVSDESMGKEALITDADTSCFSVNRYNLRKDESEPLKAPAIYVVTKGEGEVFSEEFSRPLKKGDYFFLPACANGDYRLRSQGEMQTVQCLPPEESAGGMRI